MKEVWKDIADYEGLYQVSNLGRVKSLIRKNERILKPSDNKKGYYQVRLSKKESFKSFKVHRLVAQAFIPNPDNLPQVNHKDENKKNNYINNLEWCNNKYNSRFSKAFSVLQYDMNGNFIKEWECIKDASKELKIKDCNISFCCKHKRKTAGGFKWEYKKEA